MKKIPIDFTFINGNEIRNHSFNGSIAIFLADILDGISRLNMAHNFTIITNSAARYFFSKRFPDYEIITADVLASKLRFLLRKKVISGRRLKQWGLFNKAISHYGIEKIWFPWMVPEETLGVEVDFIGTCHDLKMTRANSDESCRIMFENAVRTVTISEFVRKEVVDTYGIKLENITHIPNGIALASDAAEFKEIPELSGKRYILDVNAYGEWKNPLVLLKAFNRIKDRINLDLVFCGGYAIGDYLKECQDYAIENSIQNRVSFYLNIPESEKNWLFKNCELFVTPSENEGFGRTPIEAALCMRPVISTRATALGEVTAGLLHYYDNPQDDKELSEAIMNVIQTPDSPERLKYIRDYFVNLYSTEAVAKKYINLFREIKWLE